MIPGILLRRMQPEDATCRLQDACRITGIKIEERVHRHASKGASGVCSVQEGKDSEKHSGEAAALR